MGSKTTNLVTNTGCSILTEFGLTVIVLRKINHCTKHDKKSKHGMKMQQYVPCFSWQKLNITVQSQLSSRYFAIILRLRFKILVNILNY